MIATAASLFNKINDVNMATANGLLVTDIIRE